MADGGFLADFGLQGIPLVLADIILVNPCQYLLKLTVSLFETAKEYNIPEQKSQVDFTKWYINMMSKPDETHFTYST